MRYSNTEKRSMTKTDSYYIDKITENLDFIITHMKGVSKADLESDPVLQDSMMLRLVQISENAKLLTDTFQEAHSEIPWYDINGLRNRIVHDYGNVDLGIVYDTLTKDIPDIRKLLK